MGQKVHPISLRLQTSNRFYESSWFSDKNYKSLLAGDLAIRNYLNSVLKQVRSQHGRFFMQYMHKKMKIFLFFFNSASRKHKNFSGRRRAHSLSRPLHAQWRASLRRRAHLVPINEMGSSSKRASIFSPGNVVRPKRLPGQPTSKSWATELPTSSAIASIKIQNGRQRSCIGLAGQAALLLQERVNPFNQFSKVGNNVALHNNLQDLAKIQLNWLFYMLIASARKKVKGRTISQGFGLRSIAAKASNKLAVEFIQRQPDEKSTAASAQIRPVIRKQRLSSALAAHKVGLTRDAHFARSTKLAILEKQVTVRYFLAHFLSNCKKIFISKGLSGNLYYSRKFRRATQQNTSHSLASNALTQGSWSNRIGDKAALHLLDFKSNPLLFNRLEVDKYFKNQLVFENSTLLRCLMFRITEDRIKRGGALVNKHQDQPVVLSDTPYRHHLESTMLKGILRWGLDNSSNKVDQAQPTKLGLEGIQTTAAEKAFFSGVTFQFFPFHITSAAQGALFIANEIVFHLEQRIPFRRIKTKLFEEIAKKPWIKGIRISCSGRLGGRSKKAQRSKTECAKLGQTSLHVFSSKMDFASKSALTPFGSIGVKVWICYN